jgi:hypothetical protein
MEPPISVNGRSASISQRHLPLSIFVFGAYLSGCGAPGEPTPPSPPIPNAISDLSGHQQGNGVELVFTLPGRTTRGDRLAERPATEIFRGTLKPDGKPNDKSFRLVYTVPGELAERYLAQGKMEFKDPVAAEEVRSKPGMILAYRVRTRAAKAKDSANSNTITVQLFPVAERIASVDAKVTQNAIELVWQEPVASPNGKISEYRVYRGELDATRASAVSGDLTEAKWKSPPTLLASPHGNSYHDTLFDFGKTYVYFVRSVTSDSAEPIESDDSVPAVVTPLDTFPPAAPQNVSAAILPGAENKRMVDLSWSINAEPDLAGYRVYRSEKDGERGQVLGTELLLSPAFRDADVEAGHRYWYTITAVDRAGNESAPSDAVLADLMETLP